MEYNVLSAASIQIFSDIICCIFSFTCAISKKSTYKSFFYISSIAFLILTAGDIYYNYIYRVLLNNIRDSIGWAVTLTMLVFQLSFAYNWFSLVKRKKYRIFTTYNLPYILFTIMLISVLIYYFMTGNSPSSFTTLNQSVSITLDMLTWFFAIVCLARTRSISIIFLALGCLILIAADLSSRCLFMLNVNEVSTVHWIHIIRIVGIVFMAVGYSFCLKLKEFEFCPPNSIQESCCAWLSITSLAVFMIGSLFLSFFSLTHNSTDIRLTLWNLPIALVFTMITSVLLGNWFSNIILLPVGHFLKRIEKFNQGEFIKEKTDMVIKPYEFRMLGEFINNSFETLSTQLDREIKIAAQVAHDIRSPLSALQVVVEQRLSEIDEFKRILLRDAIYDIRDITNNLEKNAFPREKSITQIAILIEHVISERRTAIQNKFIKINQSFNLEAYSLFVNVISSEIKRIITNVINNSCEAIKSDDGVIDIFLEQKNENIMISIADNGTGVSNEISTAIFERGFTTKANGSGLGLFHAKESLAQFGGVIDVSTGQAEGTVVTIAIPSEPPPHWYISSLSILEGSCLVCVDDSISIWHAWQERFKDISKKIDLRYCNSKTSLLNEMSKEKKTPCTYLVDYEFSGEKYSGLDLIQTILRSSNHQDRVFLVTSRSSEKELQDFCYSNNIFMIPKIFALKIPMGIINSNPKNIIVGHFLDHCEVEIPKVFDKKNTIFYKNINDFIANLVIFNNQSKIFIFKSIISDQNLNTLLTLGFDYQIFNDYSLLKSILQA